jgi:hypothetical protein
MLSIYVRMICHHDVVQFVASGYSHIGIDKLCVT